MAWYLGLYWTVPLRGQADFVMLQNAQAASCNLALCSRGLPAKHLSRSVTAKLFDVQNGAKAAGHSGWYCTMC